jgi:hypothetical protein
MTRFARGWELMKRCFAVLKSDKQLMLLPIASAACCLLVSAVIVLGGVPLFLAMRHAGATPSRALIWLGIFVFYLANYMVIVFFNVALVAAASEALAGRTATLGDGLSKAWERRTHVFEWALLSATVGTILQIIESRLGAIGKLTARLLGVAWGLATFFVAPVLVFEEIGPIDALKRSSKIFRDTWGDDLRAQFSMGAVFGLLMLAGIGVACLMIFKGGTVGLYAAIPLGILFVLALIVTNATLQGIFSVAVYQYAATKTVPPGFVMENFSMAWKPKK